MTIVFTTKDHDTSLVHSPTIELTPEQAFDIRLALSDCRHKWFLIMEDAKAGKGSISVTGASIVHEEYRQLHETFIKMTET